MCVLQYPPCPPPGLWGQLDAYAKALAEIFQKPVQEKLLYFFATEEAVPV